jgi:transcriptional regulator with XRE-family HTH domain
MRRFLSLEPIKGQNLSQMNGGIEVERLERFVLGKIAEFLKKKKWTQKNLAAKMGVRESWLSQVMSRRKTRDPKKGIRLKVSDLEKFTTALEVNFSDLFPSHLMIDIQKCTIPELIRFFCLKELQSYLEELGYSPKPTKKNSIKN